MKTRIQKSTTFPRLVSALAMISLCSATVAANTENKLTSSIAFIPDTNQIE